MSYPKMTSKIMVSTVRGHMYIINVMEKSRESPNSPTFIDEEGYLPPGMMM